MVRVMLRTLPLAAALLASAASAAPIDDARSAYFRYDVNRAETLYRQIAADPAASARDKGAAQAELARIEWLVDNKPQLALDDLAASLKSDPEPCRGALLYARILNDAGRSGDVPRLLAPFAASCTALRPTLIVEIARSQILFAAALPAGRRKVPLDRARAAIVAMPPLVRASLGAARVAMDIGLLAGDGAEALNGWRDYLWLGARSAPLGSPFSDDFVTASFRAGTAPNASDSAALDLGEILTRTGFADELIWLRHDRQLEASHDPRTLRQTAYLTMRGRLEKAVLAHDRAYARNHKEDADTYEKQLVAILADGARAGGETIDADPWPALNKLWGMSGQSGVINGVGGLMMGHAVEERDSPVSQNGRNAHIRLVELDNMVENSFSSWLWDSGGGPGGWAATGLIYQIRPGYAGSTLTAMSKALPGPARDEAAAEAKRQSESDPGRLKGDEPVALPGLGVRLELQTIDEIAAQVKPGTSDAADFYSAFRKAWWDAEIDASIIIHEGRHVLDIAEYPGSCELPAPELEYRAKLVEIGLSDHPRLGLSAIIGSEMSRESSHGQADRRVVALYRDWVEAHAVGVAAYDPTTPAALQIDKLTNTQMKAIANAADPEKGPPAKCAPAKA